MATPSDHTLLTDDHPAMSFFGASFHTEWDGTVEVPYLDSLIGPAERLNVKHLLTLDIDTPYGNLERSWMELLFDISAINELIHKTNNDHSELRKSLQDPDSVDNQGLYLKQRVNAEDLCQKLKTLCDRLIMLLAVVETKRATGSYPAKIEPDSIGGFLGLAKGRFAQGKLDGYRLILDRLNTVANAQKHTFLNLQSYSVMNRKTPGVIVFYQHRNDSGGTQKLEYLIFVNLVRELNEFLLDIKQCLRNRV